MFTFRKMQVFRTFSANDWNQPEQQFLAKLFKIFSFLALSIFSLNAEKMRKTDDRRFNPACCFTTEG
jgi:hypothetical protein